MAYDGSQDEALEYSFDEVDEVSEDYFNILKEGESASNVLRELEKTAKDGALSSALGS